MIFNNTEINFMIIRKLSYPPLRNIIMYYSTQSIRVLAIIFILSLSFRLSAQSNKKLNFKLTYGMVNSQPMELSAWDWFLKNIQQVPVKYMRWVFHTNTQKEYGINLNLKQDWVLV